MVYHGYITQLVNKGAIMAQNKVELGRDGVVIINITGAGLNRSSDSVKTNETIYFYLDIPNIVLPAGLFNSVSEWVIIADK